MAATFTLNTQCSRCPRVESEEISLEEAVKMQKSEDAGRSKKALRVHFDGEVVVELEDLCESCHAIIANYLALIGKKLQHRSSLRGGEEIDVEV